MGLGLGLGSFCVESVKIKRLFEEEVFSEQKLSYNIIHPADETSPFRRCKSGKKRPPVYPDMYSVRIIWKHPQSCREERHTLVNLLVLVDEKV